MSYPGIWQHSYPASIPSLILDSLTLDAGETVTIILDEDDMVSDRDDALSTQQSIKAYVDDQIASASETRSYTFTSNGIGAGTYYLAGYYNAPAADANLSEGSPTVVLGTANISYAAHAFLVAGGAGSAAGGAGAVEIEVSGTSITDAGVRTGADTEIVVADITALALNQFVETSKKWIGQVTYTLQNASGSTQTTFSVDFNYGFNKYEDFGNRDFTVTGFECVGLGGGADSGFNIRLLFQNSAGWTYSAAAFAPDTTEITNMNTVHGAESDIANGVPFAFKVGPLSQAVNGADSQGVVIEIVTGANNTVQDMDAHVTVDIT
ncbi:MAG: hypothetical protein ACYSWP_12110 [Planctomycetota bacterium]|jgi:hypothetical protein